MYDRVPRFDGRRELSYVTELDNNKAPKTTAGGALARPQQKAHHHAGSNVLIVDDC